MRPFLLALLLVGTTGCATTRPDPPPRTLSEVAERVADQVIDVELLDGTVYEEVRVVRLTPTFLRGRMGPEPLTVPMHHVRHFEVPALPSSPQVRPTALAMLCVAPGLLGALLLAGESDEGFCGDPNDFALPVLVCGAGGGVLAGYAMQPRRKPRPQEPRRILLRIAPLSQFEDAPRGGVGLR